MTNSQRLATVRARFLRWLADQDGGDGGPNDSNHRILRESILIRDEFYCGRRLHTATHHAVWFIEEDELKIYQGAGKLVCVLSSDQIDLRPTDDQARRESQDSADILKLPAPVDRDDQSEEPIRRVA